MNNELIATTENLTLSVKTMELGKIITNALDIKDYVTEKIKSYSVDDYKGDEKQAKIDKAELNNAAEKLNSERIKLEKEWNEPFLEFKEIVRETTDLLKTASNKLDVIVKAKEEKEKNEKRSQIIEIWNKKNFDLVSIEKVFNQKWLNKTFKLPLIKEEIDCIIYTIQSDLRTLESFSEDTAILKDIYLSTLDLKTTLQKGSELKANRERLKNEAEKNKKEIEKSQNTENENNINDSKKEAEKSYKKLEIQNVEQENETTKSQAENDLSKMNDKKYLFNVIAKNDLLQVLVNYADKIGIQLIESITLKGSVNQINEFKKFLGENGKTYQKSNLTSLII